MVQIPFPGQTRKSFPPGDRAIVGTSCSPFIHEETTNFQSFTNGAFHYIAHFTISTVINFTYLWAWHILSETVIFSVLLYKLLCKVSANETNLISNKTVKMSSVPNNEMSITQPLTQNNLNDISVFLNGENWKKVGRNLQVDDAVLKENWTGFVTPPETLSSSWKHVRKHAGDVRKFFWNLFAPAKNYVIGGKTFEFAEFSMEESRESLNHASFCLRHSSDFLTYLSQYSSYYETGSDKQFLFTSSSYLLNKIGMSKTCSVLL